MASFDNYWVMAMIFGIAILFLIGVTIWETIESATDPDVFSQTTVGTNIKNKAGSFYDNLDGLFVMAFFGFHLGVLVLAFALRSHPIVYVAGVILIALLTILAAPLSNTYEEIETNSAFTSAAASLPTTSYLMSKLPFIEVVFGFVTIIILAGLARAEGFI